MKFDWRKIARIAASVTAPMIPGAVIVEQTIEGVVDMKGKTNDAKAHAVTEAAVAALQAEGEISGKQYATPRVKNAIRAVNDANVELLNALAEAHAAGTPLAGVGGTTINEG